MFNLIDNKNFKRNDYIESLKRIEACVLMLNDNFGFTNERIDTDNLKEITQEYKSDIQNIRIKLKSIPLIQYEAPEIQIKNNKHKRLLNNKRKLEKLYIETKNYYPLIIIKKEDKLFVRNYCANNIKKYYKTLSNRLLRRTSNKFLQSFGTYSINNGTQYKKIFDYYSNIY